MLKERKLGRATFRPWTSLNLRFPGKYANVLKMPGIRGIASQFVSYDAAVTLVVEFLLGRILIAEDLDTAVNAARACDRSLKIVTTDGDIVFPGGVISGGSRVAREGAGLIQARRLLRGQEADKKRLDEESLKVMQRIEQAKDIILDKERLESDLVEQLRKVELENAKLQAVQAERQREFDKSLQRVEMLRSQLGSMKSASQDDEGENGEKISRATASGKPEASPAEASNRIRLSLPG